LIGAIAIIAWSVSCSLVIFLSLRFLGILRTSPEDELAGKKKISILENVKFSKISLKLILLHTEEKTT
jgi:ammonia channel protein AmtB